MMKNEQNIFTYMLICGVCCGPISTGYILGYSSPTLRDLSGVLSTIQKSNFASLLYIGGIIGSVLIASIMDKYGRRQSILYSTVPAIISWMVILCFHRDTVGIHTHVYLLYLTRILGGISCGMNMACTTVYLVEISPTAWRGTIASLNQVGITVGIFLSYAVGKYFPYEKSAFVALAFAIGLFVTSVVIPESPRWLANKNMSGQAMSALGKMRPENHDVEMEMHEILSAGSLDPHKSPIQTVSLLNMFQPKYRNKTLIVIKLLLLQQFTGINAFISYADILFLSLLRNTYFIVNLPMIIGLVQIIFTIIASMLMDKYGRKSFLKLAGLIMALSMVSLFVSFKIENESLIMVSTASYIIGFSIGWGPVPVISSTEMLPQEARSAGGSIAVLTSWIGGYLVTGAFPFLNYTFGEGLVFLMFATICAYGVYFVSKRLPETRGLSLDEV